MNSEQQLTLSLVQPLKSMGFPGFRMAIAVHVRRLHSPSGRYRDARQRHNRLETG
jgi:hypothetical protein